MAVVQGSVRSMTGYGRGKSESGETSFTVEIRSVNHRFLDLKIRGAQLLPKHEDALRKRVAKIIGRGSVSVSIRQDLGALEGCSQIDRESAERVHRELSALAEHLGLDEKVPLSLLCSQPGVMVSASASGKEQNETVACACILEAAEEALEELVGMREAEGTALHREIEARLKNLSTLALEIGQHATHAPHAAQKRLEGRIAKLLKNSSVVVDDARLAQEIAILADKLDVTEELVRLSSHFEQLALLARKSDPVGRRLEFLVQEVGRELNTVASKSQSADVARLVIDAKAELEKIREQVQNVE